jgi:hypothetical protein
MLINVSMAFTAEYSNNADITQRAGYKNVTTSNSSSISRKINGVHRSISGYKMCN